jgi:predicted dehydrogenase
MAVSGLPESACFTSLGSALSSVETDFVVVITPPKMHADQCLEVIRAGRHVLVEKPFTRSLSSAKQVVAEAEKYGVKIGVSQNKKYKGSTMTLGRLVREEVYGRASFGMFSELSWRKKGVHHSGEDEHAYVWERGIHDFDSMRYIFSGHPKRVWAQSFNPPWSPYKGGAGVHGWAEFQSGVTCGYLHCFESHKKQSICRIDCERGTLAIEGGKLTLTHRERNEVEEASPRRMSGLHDGHHGPVGAIPRQ